MRGIVIFFLVLGSLPYSLQQPWIGVLVFSWISYMNPHKYAWGPVRSFPLALIIVLVTLIGMTATKDKWRLPRDPATVLMILLWVMFVFTTPFAFNQLAAWPQLEKVSKILLMTFVTIMLINSQLKLRYLLLVIALSVGLIGLKGGIWVFLSGGVNRVYGPAGSFLADNNDLALGLNMTLPLLLYLSKDEPRQWLRWLLKGCFVMTFVAIVFTYSRGGFLAMVLVSCLLLIKARYKAVAGIILMMGVVALLFLAPQKWSERMDTIETYQEDASAMGRINAWHTAINIALARPLTGGGFETWIPSVFSRYSPQAWNVRDVHSSYFEILGEHGFIALGLYLGLLGYALLTATRLKWIIRRNPNLLWAQHYPDMIQVSIFAYMLGGAFLGRAYFDLFYHMIAALVILRQLVLQNQMATAAEPVKVERVIPAYAHPATRGFGAARINFRNN
jgi:probable O-glycosylation ligase (exosortase A-associated)